MAERKGRTKALAVSPTLGDVARLAGVSTATVSRCLNSPEQVVEDTRRRVLEVVREIGYAPNFGARVLAAKRTNTIGAIIPTMENAIFARGLQAFQEELAVHGLTLLVASSSYRQDVEEEQIRALLARGADALLLIGFHRPAAVYDFLDRRGVPYVVAWAHRAESPIRSVGFDNRRAMQELARHVIGLGHRRLAVITAPTEQNDRARERVEGILDAAREARIDPETIDIREAPYAIENGAWTMNEIMATAPRPTVVMCGNDVLAVGAVRAGLAAGLNVPGDVSVTGFDDIELAQIVEPSLATVHVPHREMGRAAARAVAGMLRGEETGPGEPLRTRMVLRASLGPPPGA